MRKSEIIVLSAVILSFVAGIYFYSAMPESMASHWNAGGEVNGHVSKFWGLFLMPLISLAMFLLFLIIPRIDPLKANIEKFRKYFDVFIVLIFAFFLYIYVFTILWNLGIEFDVNLVLPPAFGILIFYSGVLIGKAERNYCIGIRTPWTLSSDEVWKKTHELGGKLFKISGAIAFAGLVFPEYAFVFIIAPLIFSALFTMIYSYFIYRKSPAADAQAERE